MMEKFTIMRTRRYGNTDTEVGPVSVLMRNKNTPEQAIRFCNELFDKETVSTNVELEYEVLYSKENGITESIHRVEKRGDRSK